MKPLTTTLLFICWMLLGCKKEKVSDQTAPITYGEWSACINGVQTRSFTLHIDGIAPPTDSIQRSCGNGIPVFTYGEWTDCINGIQTRTFIANTPGTTPPADSIQRSCHYDCLVQGKWKLSEYFIRFLEDSSTVDILNDSFSFPTCELDDTYQFNGSPDGGTFNYSDESTICNPIGSYSGDWSLVNNVLNYTGSERSYQIKKFSCIRMNCTSDPISIIDSSVTPPVIFQYNYNITFVRP